MRSDNLRRFRKQLESEVGIALFVVLCLALLPLLLPAAMLQSWRLDRRVLALVSGFVCVTCGTRLGTDAMRLGDERWRMIVADRHARAPGARIRLVRDIDAICPWCGQGYQYRDADRSLIARTPQTR